MKFIPQSIPDVLLIKPKIYDDNRGYFYETFRKDFLENIIGYSINFCQDNESKSSKGVIRGLHYQIGSYSQSKLVRVICGRVLDVAVDIRKSSPTFGQHVAVELSSSNKHQLFIPRGFAHGFIVLSDTARFAYKVDNYYDIDSERGIKFNDEFFSLDLSLSLDEIIISEKDKNLPLWVDISSEINF